MFAGSQLLPSVAPCLLSFLSTLSVHKSSCLFHQCPFPSSSTATSNVLLVRQQWRGRVWVLCGGVQAICGGALPPILHSCDPEGDWLVGGRAPLGAQFMKGGRGPGDPPTMWHVSCPPSSFLSAESTKAGCGGSSHGASPELRAGVCPTKGWHLLPPHEEPAAVCLGRK